MAFLVIIFVDILLGIFVATIFTPICYTFKEITLRKVLLAISVTVFILLVLTLTIAKLFIVLIVIPTIFAICIGNNHQKVKLISLSVYFSTLFFYLLMSNISEPREKSRRISCMSNLKQLGTCLYMYAEANNGHFPDRDGDAGLDMLRQQNYLTDYDTYLCPSTSDSAPKSGSVKSSYIYYGGFTTAAPEKTILMEDKPGNHKDYRNYLYCGMWVQGLKDPNYHDPSKDIVIKYLLRLLGWLR